MAPMSNQPRGRHRHAGALGRDHLAQAVGQRQQSLTRLEARELVDQCLAEIQAGIERDGLVKLHGFGVFAVADKKERLGRNPKTGEEHVISSRRVVRFRPSAIMLEAIRSPSVEAGATERESTCMTHESQSQRLPR